MFSWTLGFFTLGESRKSFMFFEVRSGNAIPNSYYCIRERDRKRERREKAVVKAFSLGW